jgi:nucleotide-binding universal stress UspA family protein
VIPDQQTLHPLVSDEEVASVRSRAIINVADVLGREGLSGDRVRVELIEDDEIDRGLVSAATQLSLDALIVGRRARRDEEPIVRLGEVTRRVLRRLPTPVIVVPPDYGSRHDRGLGEGPVMLATDLSEHGAPAAKFAQDLATRLDRELLLVHGTRAFLWAVSYVPTATMEQLQQRSTDEASQSLQRWAAAQGLGGARQHVFTGDPAKQLVQIAQAEDAAVIVTGSRSLGPVERLFLASVSSEVAAAATCPVAVVPGL